MSSEEIESHAIVIDNGSFEIKAGHASYDSPSVKLRSVVGRDMDGGSIVVGERAEKVERKLQGRQAHVWRCMETKWREVSRDQCEGREWG